MNLNRKTKMKKQIKQAYQKVIFLQQKIINQFNQPIIINDCTINFFNQ